MTARRFLAPLFLIILLAPVRSDAARVADGLVVLYDFVELSPITVFDQSGVAPPLDLNIENPGAVTWLPGGGLRLDDSTLIRSAPAATKVIAAATADNALTIEVWVQPSALGQSGPARIVTCSDSPTTRNFTLGQDGPSGGDLWSLRLRSIATSENGTPATETGPGTLTTALTHVVITRDPTGAVGFYLNGKLDTTGFVGGDLQNWDPAYPLALGNEVGAERPWLGTFHLVAFYGRALDHAEVIANFNAGHRGVPVDTAPVLVSEPIPAGAVGLQYSYQALATGTPAPTYGLVAPPAGMTIDPGTGLVTWTPATDGVYPILVTATNSAGADTQSFDVTVYAENPLDLQVWHGPDQRVGHLGDQQADFNLMGNVNPKDNVSRLEYNLNGGLYKELLMGPFDPPFLAGPRLANEGDFNADIPVTQLQPGANVVGIRAISNIGLVAVAEVTVTRETGGSQDLPVNIDWDTVADPQDVGQYVDGRWALQGDGIRTMDTGYDRLFLIGEKDWQDYDILVPVTIHEVIDGGNESGLGILMRFTGHVAGGISGYNPDYQPKSGYLPFGSIGWLRWMGGSANPPEMHFHYGDTVDWWSDDLPPLETGKAAPFDPNVARRNAVNFGPASVVSGNTYFMRMRCETLADTPQGEGVTHYSWKIWDAVDLEPVDWIFEITQESDLALRRGGVVFVAHYVDATFGDVVITDLDSDPSPVPGPVAGRIMLHQNQPNPFNPLTIIRMDVPRAAPADLAVYDIQGRLVRNLYRGSLPAGLREFRWDGRDETGREVAGGVYFFRLEAAGDVQTRKMTLVR